MRALRAAFPARSPLLPARMRSLRVASVFLTSPPQQDKRARSGTLRLYYTSKQTTGETNPETHWGNTRNPPGPEKHGPVPGFPPDPHSCLPRQTQPTVLMPGESARHRPRIPHRSSRARKPASTGGTRETPHSPVSPVPPDPLRPLPPARGRAARATADSHTAPTPASTERGRPGHRHRGTAPPGQRGKAPATDAVRSPSAARCPCRPPGMPRSVRVLRVRPARRRR